MNLGEPGRMPAGMSGTPPFAVLVVTLVAVLGHACLWCGMPVGRWILPTALARRKCATGNMGDTSVRAHR